MKKNAKNLFTLLIEILKKKRNEKNYEYAVKIIIIKIHGMDINLLFIYQCLLRFLCVILRLSDVPSSFCGVIWKQRM